MPTNSSDLVTAEGVKKIADQIAVQIEDLVNGGGWRSPL